MGGFLSDFEECVCGVGVMSMVLSQEVDDILLLLL